MVADVVNSLYNFFNHAIHQGEHVLHMSELELVLTVIAVLFVLLLLVVWWKRRVDRYNEAVWKAGRYTANDPYKERDMLKVVQPKDPWIVADPIGGSEVGEAMEVESLTDFMKKATPIQSSTEPDNGAVTVIKSTLSAQSSGIDEPLSSQIEVPVFHESRTGVRPVPDHGLATLQQETDMPAGWYPEPSGMAGFFRYWDGNRWTGSISKREGHQSSGSSDLASPAVGAVGATDPSYAKTASGSTDTSRGASPSTDDGNREVII